MLLPFGIIHLWIVILRNKLYDWQIFKTYRLPKPVISIGNIQLGGTGKTPLTITMLKKLQSEGRQVGVLSRGYKRKSEEIIILKPEDSQNQNLYEIAGDEPAIIIKELANGVLGIRGDRYRVGKKLLEKHPVDKFLLDDGLQHRKLHRDLDICLIDVGRWQRHPFLFPFSYLRDSKTSLKRCQVVVLTKIGRDRDKAERLKKEILAKYNIPVFEGDLEPQSLINIRDEVEISLLKMKGQKVAGFCGIARPNHFFNMLKQNGLDLVLAKKFPDHHNYAKDDIYLLVMIMKEKGAKTLITTEKDAVKLKHIIQENIFEKIKIYFLKVDFVVKKEKEFFSFVTDLMGF